MGRVTVEGQNGTPSAVGDLRTVSGRRSGLVASALLMISALLQGAAAAQRWAFADPDTLGSDRNIEDHLFDYVIPADPWVSVGSAAILFGLSYLLVGGALVCLGVAGRAIAGRIRGIPTKALVAAAPFVLIGLHALVSGLAGVPTPVQHLIATYGAVVVGAFQVLVLVVFAVFIAVRSWIWAIGVLLLIGDSLFGYVAALFFVAPILVGYQSYDTTPWTEGVLAAATAAAAVAICIGALRLPAAPLRSTKTRPRPRSSNA